MLPHGFSTIYNGELHRRSGGAALCFVQLCVTVTHVLPALSCSGCKSVHSCSASLQTCRASEETSRQNGDLQRCNYRIPSFSATFCGKNVKVYAKR